MRTSMIGMIIFLSFFATTGFAGSKGPAIPVSDPLDRLVMCNGKVVRFDIGIGSGACRLASDP